MNFLFLDPPMMIDVLSQTPRSFDESVGVFFNLF